ncbi:MAG: cell division protein FtsZ, partial [Bacteroidia bacterium]
VPAYKRKGVNLEDVAHSSEMEISRTSLIEEPEKKPELRTNNSFLHDNVD